MDARPNLTPHLLLTLCVLFWAGNAIVGKLASGHIPPFTLSFWRWAFALLIILPFGAASVSRQREFYRKNFRQLCLLALLSVTAYNTLQYWALNWTTAINVGVISASMPMMIILLTGITGSERASLPQLLGVLLATVGVLWVIARADLRLLLELEVNFGDALMLAAVVSWAVYSVMLRRLPPGVDPIGLLTVLIFLGLIGIGPFYGWELAAGERPVIDRQTVLIVAYVSIFASVLAYVFWNYGVRAGGANLAGFFVNLTPVFVAIMAVVFLDESLSSYHLVGIGLVFAGIYLATVVGHRRGI